MPALSLLPSLSTSSTCSLGLLGATSASSLFHPVAVAAARLPQVADATPRLSPAADAVPRLPRPLTPYFPYPPCMYRFCHGIPLALSGKRASWSRPSGPCAQTMEVGYPSCPALFHPALPRRYSCSSLPPLPPCRLHPDTLCHLPTCGSQHHVTDPHVAPSRTPQPLNNDRCLQQTGGYQFRLCPADADLTEACFQRTPIPFGGRTWLEWGDGKRLEINGT